MGCYNDTTRPMGWTNIALSVTHESHDSHNIMVEWKRLSEAIICCPLFVLYRVPVWSQQSKIRKNVPEKRGSEFSWGQKEQ